MLLCFFFFFKQKTAYEMRISDWSSDVCSSDLVDILGDDQQLARPRRIEPRERGVRRIRRLGLDRRAAGVIEALDQLGLARKGLGRCALLDEMLLPPSDGVAQCVDAPFRRPARPGQDADLPAVAQSINSVTPELIAGTDRTRNGSGNSVS